MENMASKRLLWFLSLCFFVFRNIIFKLCIWNKFVFNHFFIKLQIKEYFPICKNMGKKVWKLFAQNSCMNSKWSNWGRKMEFPEGGGGGWYKDQRVARSRLKWFLFSGSFYLFFFLVLFRSSHGWRALSGSQYCGADNAILGVIVSMSRCHFLRHRLPLASCHFPHSTSNPSMCTEWFLLLQLQTELVVHTFHSNFHLAILSGCRSSPFVLSVHFPRFFVDRARTESRLFLQFSDWQPSGKSKLISCNQAHLSHVVRFSNILLHFRQ